MKTTTERLSPSGGMKDHAGIIDCRRRGPGVRLRGAGVILLAALFGTAAFAADQSLEQGAKQAGRATGSVFHDIGQGAKKAGIEIGHAAADAGKKIGHGAAEAGRTIGRATSQGAKEFWHALKGES